MSYDKKIYDCDNAQTAFPFNFPLTESGDLVVKLRDKQSTPPGQETDLYLTSSYTLAKKTGYNDYSQGGTVTTVATYSSRYQLVLAREVPYAEGFEVPYNDPHNSNALNDVVNRFQMQIQQLKEEIDRSYKMPIGDPTAISAEGPSSEERGGKYAYWDAITKRLIGASLAANDLTVSAFMEGLLANGDAATALGTLGAYSKDEVDAKSERTVTIEDAVAANDVIVTNWGRTKYHKASSSWGPIIDVENFETDDVETGSELYSLSRLGDTNKWLFVYRSVTDTDVNARILEVDADGDITAGSVSVPYGFNCSVCVGVAVTDSLIVVAYNKGTPGPLCAKAATVSGTTIGAWGSEVTLYGTQNVDEAVFLCRKNDTHVCVLFQEVTGDLISQVWSISGTTMTQQGSNKVWSAAASAGANSMCALADDWMATLYQITANPHLAYVEVNKVSDGGIWTLSQGGQTFGSPDMTAAATAVMIINLEDGIYACGVNMDGSYAHACLIVEVDTDEETSRPLFSVRDPIGDLMLSGWKQENSSGASNCGFAAAPSNEGMTIIGKQGPVGVVHFDKATHLGQAGNFVVGTRGKDYGLGVQIHTSTGAYAFSIEARPRVIGFAAAAAGASSSLVVQRRGLMSGFAGLVAEKDYYLTKSGMLATRGLVKVGRAISSTELIIDIEDPW